MAKGQRKLQINDNDSNTQTPQVVDALPVNVVDITTGHPEAPTPVVEAPKTEAPVVDLTAFAEAATVAAESQENVQANIALLVNPGTTMPNRLFANEKAAIAALHHFQLHDKRGLDWIRSAMREMVEAFAMNADPQLNTANPLTFAVRALRHRDHKGGYAVKAINWTEACTNYKWNKKSDCFKLREGKRANTTFNDAQREAFAVHFDHFTKPSGPDKWTLDKAIKAAIAKAERKGLAREDIAKTVKVYDQGVIPEVVNVAEPRVIPANTAKVNETDTAD